jgi:hypothetical protein
LSQQAKGRTGEGAIRLSKKRPTLESVSSTDLVRVERSPKYADPLDGFIVAVGSKWALMHRVREGGYFDGYAAFRVSDVRRIRVEDSWVARFAATQAEWPPRCPPDIDLGSTKAAISSLAAHGRLVGLEKEREREALWIGVPRTFSPNAIQLHGLGTDALWNQRPLWYRLKAITAVSIQARYLNALAAVVDFDVAVAPQYVGFHDALIGNALGDAVGLLNSDRFGRSAKRPTSWDYSVRVINVGSDSVELQLVQGDRTARLEVPLPSSPMIQPWIYMRPEDATDWAQQFLTWLDDEMFTGGLLESRARVDINGESHVIVQPYGFQLSDSTKHEKFLKVTGPHGWYGRSPN